MQLNENTGRNYSPSQKKRHKFCLMKQKCQIQMGKAQYENAATPWKTRGIYNTHQYFI